MLRGEDMSKEKRQRKEDQDKKIKMVYDLGKMRSLLNLSAEKIRETLEKCDFSSPNKWQLLEPGKKGILGLLGTSSVILEKVASDIGEQMTEVAGEIEPETLERLNEKHRKERLEEQKTLLH
jgi:hypothetical protein